MSSARIDGGYGAVEQDPELELGIEPISDARATDVPSRDQPGEEQPHEPDTPCETQRRELEELCREQPAHAPRSPGSPVSSRNTSSSVARCVRQLVQDDAVRGGDLTDTLGLRADSQPPVALSARTSTPASASRDPSLAASGDLTIVAPAAIDSTSAIGRLPHEPAPMDDHDLVRRSAQPPRARGSRRGSSAPRPRASGGSRGASGCPADRGRSRARRARAPRDRRAAPRRDRAAAACRASSPSHAAVPALPSSTRSSTSSTRDLGISSGDREHAEVISTRPARVRVERLEERSDLLDGPVERAIRDAEDRRAPRGRMDEPENRPHGRRLPGAVRAEEAGDRPRRDREREIVDREGRAVPLREPLDLDH